MSQKVKCPYCDFRNTKPKVVNHIEKNHKDMLSEEYTASRCLFNYLNKKEYGSCVICKNPTEWNEETWKYKRFCSNKCKKEYVKIAKGRMVNKYGKEHLLNDSNQQKKMLSNRKISGEYKWSDGTMKSYCGSYELKLLEFYDKVLHVDSADLETPGPIIEYEFNGETHQWITDMYYIPANLVHDVKDGGDNPNKREMPEYRAKQVAKEKAIKKLDKYNYIRLTNNSFEQLLYILAEIKESLMDNQKEYIININEDAVGGAIPQLDSEKDTYIIPCFLNNSFVGTAISDKYFNKVISRDKDGNIKKGNYKLLNNYDIKVYKVKDNKKLNKIDYNNTTEDLYEMVMGKKLLSEDQFDFDTDLVECGGIIEDVERNKAIKESLLLQFNEINESRKYVSTFGEYDYITEGYNNLEVCEDENGLFILNSKNNCRTSSYSLNKLYEMSDILINMINNLNIK